MVGFFGGDLLFIWVSLIKINGTGGFPTIALGALSLPVASIGLGLWTWREKKVRVLASVYAVAAGVLGLGLAATLVAFGFILVRLF
jgi:hypothetical protein